MLILNDLHIGVQRKAGTTPTSQEALRAYQFTVLEDMLVHSNETHLLILGDLFDEFEVAPRDWVQTYLLLQDWCVRKGDLTLVAGNHDHSPKALRMSSFQMLCRVLGEQFGGDRFTCIDIDQWQAVGGNTYTLAHCSNQETFNLKLSEILAVVQPGDRVLLHANYDNNFAAVSDHSLNVSADLAREFVAKGATLIFAHEHQAKAAQGGSVAIFGNQWPTSVADCLGNDIKYAHILDSLGISKIETWRHDGDAGYQQVPWDLLADYPVNNGAGFIRVFGSATSNQAGDVITAIAKFRQKSDAFVITNAVKIDGIVGAEDLPATFEVAKAFDVLEYIFKQLSPEESAVVRGLLEEAQ